MATLLTAPPRYLVATFVCGLAGRLVRDLLTGWGMGPNWSTVLAAAAVVLVAVAFIRRQQVSPVVLVCGVLPLGSAVAMFNAILELMKLSTAQGDALSAATWRSRPIWPRCSSARWPSPWVSASAWRSCGCSDGTSRSTHEDDCPTERYRPDQAASPAISMPACVLGALARVRPQAH